MRKAPPPTGYTSWLDYAVATMDARSANLERAFEQNEVLTSDEIRLLTQQELEHLRQTSHQPWIRIPEHWRPALLNRLGLSADDPTKSHSLVTEFASEGVRIRFKDGSTVHFRNAFYLGMTTRDIAIAPGGVTHRVAVFTEHCGFHEFWIGPEDHIEMVTPTESEIPQLPGLRRSLQEVEQGMVAPYQFGPSMDEDADWDQVAPVGRELGSPDYDRLMQQDAAKFNRDLLVWIQDAMQYIGGEGFESDLTDYADDIHNIQRALRALGHEVTVQAAASVWIHYSKSLGAGWMAGADTVASAARTLYLNCPRSSE